MAGVEDGLEGRDWTGVLRGGWGGPVGSAGAEPGWGQAMGPARPTVFIGEKVDVCQRVRSGHPPSLQGSLEFPSSPTPPRA